MAFYSARVDDDGKEIERRLSVRSLSTASSNSNVNSLRSFDSNSSINRDGTNRSNVRYVNPAAYVEKGDESDRSSSIMSEMPSENQSDIVPPLDLQSEDNYPTTRDCTFSYRKHCEAAKIDLKPDLAYETWLSAKRKLLSDAAARRKKAEEQKKKEKEERKRMAEENFCNWLSKKMTASKQSSVADSMTTVKTTTTAASSVAATNLKSSKQKQELSEDEKRRLREEWEKKKIIKMEKKRLAQKKQQQRLEQMKEQRREMASQAWEQWIAQASKKPKPVPLNKGISTLRGTISDIYVNPNKWVSILPTEDDD